MKVISLAFFCLLLTSLAHADNVPQVCDKGNCVQVEVVSKQADLERGLMYRSSLPSNAGMLFVFQDEAIQSFWMKNMHFALDILWIGQDKRIAYIGHALPACQVDPCPVYTPSAKALYVLELNSDYTLKHHWQVGDKLDLYAVLEK